MKKIIIAVILIVVMLPSITLAASDTFYEGEYLPDAYIKKFKSGATTGKYEQMRMFRRTSDNTPAYCIELWENISSSESMNSIEISNYNLLSQDILDKIELYAYYGYGYQNHTDLNWYTATQFLIWKATSQDSNIYFTDTLNGNRVDKFVAEMNEIENLVNRHNILPSFHNNTYELGVKEELILEDTNHVLENYNVIPNYLNPAYKDTPNTLKIKTNYVGTTTISFEKGSSTNRTLIYSSSTSQDLLIRGNYRPVKGMVTLKVTAGKINISKIDIDTKKYEPQGEASLDGTTYNLYDVNHNFIETIRINTNGKGVSTNLPYGTYYIKENSTGVGYQLDNNTYQVTVTKDEKTKYLTLSNQVIKSKIKINKSYQPLNSDKTYNEENTIFSFYNKNHEKVGEIKTSQDGEGEITLPYGTYYVKQETGKENYQMVEDFTVVIDENTLPNLEYHFINHEYGSSLKITKIDRDSKLPIRLSKASFKIKDIINDKYITYNKKDIFQTDNNGILLLPIKLKIGKYQLEEITPPIGYQLMKKSILIEVTKDSEELIEIEIENEKELGKLEIIKYGEVVDVKNNQLEYSKETLSNVEYSLYASEDIISGDGKTHYKKDELIMKKETNEEGIIIFDNLMYGKYYVVETKNLESYNEDSNKYYVEINKDNLSGKMEKINSLKKGNLKINKVDSLSLLPIYNVEFEIYDEENRKINSLKTNQSGEIYIPNLPLGTYYIKEKSVPFPYLIDHDIVEVTITENNELVEVTLKNEKQYLEEVVPNTQVENKRNNLIHYIYLLVNITFLAIYFKKI